MLDLFIKDDNIALINKQTAEQFRLTTLKKQQMLEYVVSLTDEQKAELLTKASFVNRVVGGLEDVLKGWVKSLDHEFDDQNHAYWQGFRLTKKLTPRFNEKKLLAEGSEEEKELWAKLKQKFTVSTESVSI